MEREAIVYCVGPTGQDRGVQALVWGCGNLALRGEGCVNSGNDAIEEGSALRKS